MENLENIKNKILQFRDAVKQYRDLLSISRDRVLPEIVRNIDEIDLLRSNLIKTYAKLEKFIKKIGNNPMMSNGVWNVSYSPYANAFTKDVLPRIGKSTDLIIGDLDYIIGKLEVMSEKELNNLFIDKNSKGKNLDNAKSLHKEYWRMIYKNIINWVTENKIISGIIIAVVAGVIILFLQNILATPKV